MFSQTRAETIQTAALRTVTPIITSWNWRSVIVYALTWCSSNQSLMRPTCGHISFAIVPDAVQAVSPPLHVPPGREPGHTVTPFQVVVGSAA